ncbi:hypothetical protein FDP41_007908 [Naegleria fowleri]|uniref:Nucleoporin NSP1-like C-terminal domain-containing protein n=1 Tax=Naegleria fowleri TaxID=5763 RepID=A0A6A5C0M7_NAEFO|nr:uncharacterized protein FDP41_007908 [Naegleria fowleri]KAF0983993.1 hypothetical protein FDP41_007908 [Naegleria fowleri]CAG4713832.1 unnamed protein product [Naegleria fowleri]
MSGFTFGNVASNPSSTTTGGTTGGGGFTFNFGTPSSQAPATSVTATTQPSTSTGSTSTTGGFTFPTTSTATTSGTTAPSTTTTTTQPTTTTAGTTGGFTIPSSTTTTTTTGTNPTASTTGATTGGFNFGAPGSTPGLTTTTTAQPGNVDVVNITPKTTFQKLPDQYKKAWQQFEKEKTTNREKAVEIVKQQENANDTQKIKKHIVKIEKKINASKVNIGRSKDTVETLKHDVLVESKNAEQAQNNFNKLRATYTNIDPNYSSTYFINTAQKLEQRMQEIWKEIEDISQTLSHGDAYQMPFGQLLQGTIVSQQQAFFNAAARLSVLHEKVNELKELYIRTYQIKGDPFKEPSKTTKPSFNYSKSLNASLPGLNIQPIISNPTSGVTTTAPTTTTGFSFGNPTTGGTTGGVTTGGGFNFGGTTTTTTTTAPTTTGFNFGGTSTTTSGTGGFNLNINRRR